MQTQWVWLGLALASTVSTMAAVARPNGFVRGNVAWSACGWLAGEFAPWLAALTLILLLTLLFATPDVLAGEPGRLALLLLVASGLGQVAVMRRGSRAAAELEMALRQALGAGYQKAVPSARMPALLDRVPRRSYLHPLPRRPRDVELLADLPYPGGHARSVLDVYRPVAACHNAPVLLQVHGGDWTHGHKRQQALPLVHHLAALGWIVVTPNYRLAPEARMPSQLVDCKAALAWTRAHIAGMGGDPSFIAVSGGGAGAHLAALLALTFDDPTLQPGFEHVDTRPAACIALHGVFDLADRARREPGRAARLRWLGRNLLPCAFERDATAWDAASPLGRIQPDAPPFFVLHGTHDALCHVNGARDFVRELRRVSGQPVAYAELAGAQHGWDTLCSPRALHTARAVTRFLEWCAAHHRAHGSRLDSPDRARS
jgi:acetyl esterase/lipase